MSAQTHLFRCLSDNFGVLVHDPAIGATAAIDAPEAGPVETALRTTGWKLTDILVTHHHADHTGGVAELKARHRCRVTAPRNEAAGACERPWLWPTATRSDIGMITSPPCGRFASSS